MNEEVEIYIQKVLRHIPVSGKDRQRLEDDLGAHLREALKQDDLPTVLARMGKPQEVAEEFMRGVKLRYAGFWKRLFAFIIDMAFCVLVFLLSFVIGLVLNNAVPQHPEGLDDVIGAILIFLVLALALTVVGTFLLYFPMLEGRYGRTLGKRLLGLRVIRENGTSIGFKEAFLRRLPFYFDFIVIDVLFIPFTAKKQRGFDLIAQTLVIEEA